MDYQKKLSIAVMAHPSREKFFQYLKEKLGDVPFSIDHQSEGVWKNAKKAWAMFDPSAEYHVVIQDDAVVCDDFKSRAEAVIKVSGGDKAVSFYFGRRGNLTTYSQEGMKRGFIVRSRMTWGVAMCLRTEWIPEMLEYCERFDHPADDFRVSRFLAHKGIWTFHPMPSLIDHRTSEETASLVGDPGANRCAYAFIDKI